MSWRSEVSKLNAFPIVDINFQLSCYIKRLNIILNMVEVYHVSSVVSDVDDIDYDPAMVNFLNEHGHMLHGSLILIPSEGGKLWSIYAEDPSFSDNV